MRTSCAFGLRPDLYWKSIGAWVSGLPNEVNEGFLSIILSSTPENRCVRSTNLPCNYHIVES